jgi:mono/diheme cytochrome c family protein
VSARDPERKESQVDRGRFRRRSTVLGVIAIVMLIGACGRATEQQIDQALGITPTPTVDPVAAAQATEDASMAIATPDDADAGVAALGRTKFQFNCQTCHVPGGSAPDLLESGGPYADIDYATLYPILREGEGHTPSPGPYASFVITDADIANIGAFIREQAAP